MRLWILATLLLAFCMVPFQAQSQYTTAIEGLDRYGTDSTIPSQTQSITIGAGTKHDGFVISDEAEIQTTDASQTTLDSITLLDENTYHVEVYVAGVLNTGGGRATYHLATTVYRTGAGSATMVGSPTTIHTQESSSDDATLDATFTVSGNDVRVSVKGIAAETWEWGSTMQYMNMSN